MRIMRVLSVINFVTEVGHERYMANDITRMMADPITDGVVKTWYVIMLRNETKTAGR